MTGAVGEGVADYTEWHHISDFPKVCGSCNRIRINSHKMRKDVCLPRTSSIAKACHGLLTPASGGLSMT